SHDLRMLAVVTAVACVLCASMVASARGSAAAPTPTKSTAVTKSPARAAAAERENELNEHLQQMTERLKLTDDQAAKVRVILETRSARMHRIHATYNAQLGTPENKDTMERAQQRLHAEMGAKLARVLTPDQMA